MTKTVAMIDAPGSALVAVAMGLMPAVETMFKAAYEERPGTLDDGVPDRISIERSSKFYTNNGQYLAVLLDGAPCHHCVEYCVSEGWVRVGVPTADGKVSATAAARAEKKRGVVDVRWRIQPSRQVRRAMARIGR